MKEKDLKSKIIVIRDFILMVKNIWNEISQYYSNSEMPNLNKEMFVQLWENKYHLGSWNDKYELHIRQPKKISVNEIKVGFNFCTYIDKTVNIQMNLLNPINEDNMILFLHFDEESDNRKNVSRTIANLKKTIIKFGKKISDKEFVQKINESFNIF